MLCPDCGKPMGLTADSCPHCDAAAGTVPIHGGGRGTAADAPPVVPPAADDDRTTPRSGPDTPQGDAPTLPSGRVVRDLGDSGWPLRDDQYEDVKQIGQGGMGAVWLVRDRRNGRLACRKRPQDLTGSVMTRFVSEIRVLADNWCKDIVECLDFGRDDKGPFLVMPYYRRGSLYQRVRDRGPLDGKALTELAQAMGRALSHLHGKSILHRDIKPANILLTDDDQPVLADFGLVRVESGMTTMQHGGRFGTAAYMAPELLDGADASPVTDIYALGLTLRYAATGCSPGAGRDADIPPAMRSLILRCTSPLPMQRHQSAQDFLRAIDQLRELRPGGDEIACPACSSPIDRGARHCAHCGEALFARCEACTQPMRRGARHCEKCGCSVATWQQALDLEKQGAELLAEGRFSDLHSLTTRIAALTPGAIRLAEGLRRRSAEIEPKVTQLRRRAQIGDRENGPRATATLWRQLLDHCAADVEALEMLRTLDERERRHVSNLLRVEAERCLQAGELAAAAVAIGELRAQAVSDDAEAMHGNLARRLAEAEDRARAERAAAIEQFVRRGDVTAARVALAAARAAGMDRATCAGFEARIRTIQRVVWNRDLKLTAAVLMLLGGLLVGIFVFRDRSAFADGREAFLAGRFAEAASRFRSITLPDADASRAADAADGIAATADTWDKATAATLHRASGRLGEDTSLTDVVSALAERRQTRLRREIEQLDAILAGDGLRGRDGSPWSEPVDGVWSIAIAGPAPIADADRVDIACQHVDGARFVVSARIRRKDLAPSLRWVSTAPGSATANTLDLAIGETGSLPCMLDDAQARPTDAPPAVTCTSSTPAVALPKDPVRQPDGTWRLPVTGVAAGEAEITWQASDFCGNRSTPLRTTVRIRPIETPRTGPTAPPAPPQLLGTLPATTRDPGLPLEAKAGDADVVHVLDATDGRQLTTLSRRGDVFAGEVRLAEGVHRLQLRARNDRGESAAVDIGEVRSDRTPPVIVARPQSLVEVGEELVVTFDEELGDATTGDLVRRDGKRAVLEPCPQVGVSLRTVRAADRAGNVSDLPPCEFTAVRRTSLVAADKQPGQRLRVPGSPRFVAVGADKLIYVVDAVTQTTVAFGDLGPPRAITVDSDGRIVLAHASGSLSWWRCDPNSTKLTALGVPRPALRAGEQATALASLADERTLLMTRERAALCNLRDGYQESAGLRPPSRPPQQVVFDGAGFVALLDDGSIEHTGQRPTTWSATAAMGSAPSGIVHLATPAQRTGSLVLAATKAGAIWRGVRAKDPTKGHEWSLVDEAADGGGAAITALSCNRYDDGFAVGAADGSVRASSQSGARPRLIVAARGGPVTFLAGPFRTGDIRRVLVGTADGAVNAVEYR